MIGSSSMRTRIRVMVSMRLLVGLSLLGSLHATQPQRPESWAKVITVSTPPRAAMSMPPLHVQALAVRGGSFASQDDSENTGFPGDQRTPPIYTQQDEYAAPGDLPGDRETVQDRVDAWRNFQHEKYAQQTSEQAASPRDEQGRVKLMASVSKGSRALIFFFEMWRDVHLYEVADQTFKGTKRLFTVTPLIILFIANLGGVVASLTSPSHSAKKRLKAILNLDKFVEMLLIVFYFIRLTVAPSKYTPREIYIANTLHSVFFILQCQSFTKVSWDDLQAAPGGEALGLGESSNPYYGTAGTGNNEYAQQQQSGAPPSNQRNNNY